MTEGAIPEWLNPVPFGDVGHGQIPGDPQQWDVMSEDQLEQMRLQLIESILSSVVQAVRGIFLPGPFGAALEQLVEWATTLLLGEDLLDAINGEYEGENLILLAIQLAFFPLRLIIKPLAEWLSWLWKLFANVEPNPPPTGPGADLLVPIFTLIDSVWEAFTYAFGNLLEDLFRFFNWLWRRFANIPLNEPPPTGPGFDILVPIFSLIDDIWDMFTYALGNLLRDVFGWLNWLWRLFANIPGDNPEPTGPGANILVPIFKWLDSLWEAFGDVVEDVFAFVMDIFKPMAPIFNGDVVGNVIKEVVEFFNDIIGNFGSIADGLPSFADIGQVVLDLINAITGGFASTVANGIAAILDLFSKLPLIGPIIEAFVPPEWRNAVAQPASSLADLKSYATELLKTDSVVYSQNLYGQIPADLLPPTGSGDVADFKPNLVADPSFRSAAAVQAGEGWSWDSTTSRTPGDGGSAKLTGDGGVKQMFSNKVAVSPGQEIEVSVYAKWTKPSAARPTIGVGLRAYNGEAVLFTNSFGLQSNVVTDSSGVAGQVGGWVELKGTYAIPLTTPMTHVRLSLSVLNAPAGTSVWFDEASLRKVSLIRPALVGGVGANSDSLADDIENAVGVEDYQALLDRVAKKTGATLADVQATIEDFLDGDSEISGNQITSGQIASRYINELIDTWNKINGGINGPTAYADGTIDSAFVALTNFRENFSANGTKVNEAVTAANNALGRAAVLERSYKELYDYATAAGRDARAAAIQVGLVPQTPVNPPSTPTIQFREANDSFNRTDLGSAWTASRKVNNQAAFVLDGNNVRFKAADITTVDSIGAAVHTGGGGLTDFQRVYAVLGSSPGVPLLGTPGYNDLIGRAASGTSCVVARFYGTNIVRLFYRNAGWEVWPWEPATTFGTFSLPAGVSVRSGAMIELYVGNKSISDQTKCSVRVGSWASPAATLPASILPVLGRGWGFGGGNGISGVAAQQSALFDSWGAQDQV